MKQNALKAILALWSTRRLTVCSLRSALSATCTADQVVKHRLCIQAIRARHLLQRLLPRTRLTCLEHLRELLACGLRPVKTAAIQRPLVPAGFAHRLVELELVDSRQETASIRHIGWNVILRSRIKISFRTLHRRRNTLILCPQCPPRLVVIGRFDPRRRPAISICRAQVQTAETQPCPVPCVVAAEYQLLLAVQS